MIFSILGSSAKQLLKSRSIFCLLKFFFRNENLLFQFLHYVQALCYDELRPLFNVIYICNPFPNKPWFFTCLQYKCFENTMGKGEIARNEQFLLFPTVFPTLLENFLSLSSNLKMSSLKSLSLEDSKIFYLGKG